MKVKSLKAGPVVHALEDLRGLLRPGETPLGAFAAELFPHTEETDR